MNKEILVEKKSTFAVYACLQEESKKFEVKQDPLDDVPADATSCSIHDNSHSAKLVNIIAR